MNFFRKSRPAIESLFRGFTSKTPKPTPQPKSTIPVHPQFKPLFSSGISRSHIPTSFSSSSSSKASLIGRRFFYVDGPQLQHFKPRGPRRWYESPRYVFVVVTVGSVTLVSIYFGNLDTVPYTRRKHFVLLSQDLERKLGEAQFEELKTSLKDKILPPTHPDSIRVRLIAKRIIDALQRGLRYDSKVWRDVEYASEVPEAGVAIPEGTRDTISALSDVGRRSSEEVKWSSKDEVLDDEWVQESRKKGRARRSEPATQHLEGLNWEVLVVRNPVVNAMCLPGGKIIVFTGLLDHFRTDAEIATVLAHETGHAIARHSAEAITKNLWLAVLQLIALQFIWMPDLVNAVSNLLLKLPFSRRMEMEADYIGLLLMAAAGYDPRVAPKVYEKLGVITGDSILKDYLSTHPSSKKRAQVLSHAQVMEEALALYREAIAGHGVEGFF